jgi:membrane fusion protein, protease secretion system
MNKPVNKSGQVDRIFDRLRLWTQSFNPYVPEQLTRDGMEPVRIEESSVKRQAGKVVFVTFMVFVIWAVTAPLDEGSVATGNVAVMGSRKAVQHPSGGVVEEILVQEGNHVNKGDPLLRVNPLNIDANLQQAENEFINALASYSRLIAERTSARSIIWDGELLKLSNTPHAKESKALQQALFVSRRSEHLDQSAILRRQGEGLRQQIKEKKSILVMRQSQLGPMAEDAENMRKLASDGFVPRSNANTAERSSLDSQIGITTLQSDIANTEVAIASNELELSKLKSAYHKEVDAELASAQTAKEALRARLLSLRFDQSLSTIKAPASGVITALKAHTVGGVITGGQVLMEIVPDEQKLIIEAAIPLTMIDKVTVGMPTDLRFTAFNQNTTPVIPGLVKLVGADKLPPQPPQFPTEYFLALIEPTPEGYQMLADKSIGPGMPVEAIIKKGERSFMSYLLKPLIDRFVLAFKD